MRTLVLCALFAAAVRAETVDVCSPAPAVKESLDRLPRQTPAETGWQFHEKSGAAIRALLNQYPDDIFVHRANIRSTDWKDKDKFIAEYKARHEQHPDSAPWSYLYGMTLVGRQSKDAIRLFTGALEKDPKFPWPHLQLVDIYNSEVFSNKEESTKHLKAFLDACPASFQGYEPLTRVDDKDLLRTYDARLRALIASRNDADAIGAYRTLWSLEFKAHPPSEYEGLRKQVSQDLERIRGLSLQDKREWYEALESGYKLVNDQKQSDWAQDQAEIRFPSPWSTPAMSKWLKEHHSPADDAAVDAKRAYYRDLLEQTTQGVKDCPHNTAIRRLRLRALEHLDDASATDVQAAVDQMMKVATDNAGPDGPESAYYFNAAGTLSKKHLQPEQVVELAREGLAQWEIESKEPFDDLYATKENVEGYKFYIGYSRIEGMQSEIAGYLQLKQPEKAQIELAQMDERLQELKSLAGDKQDRKKDWSVQVAAYWGLMARAAELQGRKLDAMAFYENALLTRLDAQKKPETGVKDDLADNAHQLWARLGGTDDGWKIWYGRRADALAKLATLTWEDANQPLPPFEIADLKGKTWGLASLRGKVTFLNFWAEW